MQNMTTSKFKVSVLLASGETSIEIFAWDVDAARSAVVDHFESHGEQCEVLGVGPV